MRGSAATILGSSNLATRLWALDAGATVSGELTADLGAPGTPFSRMIFGQFLEHFQRQVYGGIFDPGSPLANRHGFRSDVLEALRELKVPIVRWPGGCFASAYHWRDGVGKDRQPSFDKAWGVEDPNTFGTDEFIKWCYLLGAEPYICTNAGTGTSEEISNWVEYCNLKNEGRYARMRAANGSPDPFKVRYWSIGNENYLGGEIGAKTVEEWGPLVRESAKMMRAVDSDLQILAAATVTGNWTPPMLKDAGKYLNFISIHGYWDALWQRGTHPSDYLHCMAFCEAPERQIQQAIELLNQTGFGDRIKIAFDEWNLRGWHHPGFPGGGANQLAEISERDENDLVPQPALSQVPGERARKMAGRARFRDIASNQGIPIRRPRDSRKEQRPALSLHWAACFRQARECSGCHGWFSRPMVAEGIVFRSASASCLPGSQNTSAGDSVE